METKDIILELRKKNKLSQDELAKKVMVTRQAVSRWKMEKQFQILKLSNFFQKNSTFPSIRF